MTTAPLDMGFKTSPKRRTTNVKVDRTFLNETNTTIRERINRFVVQNMFEKFRDRNRFLIDLYLN